MEETRLGRRAKRPTFSNRLRERILASRPAVLITGIIAAVSLIVGGGYTAAQQILPTPEVTAALDERPTAASRQFQREALEGVERVKITVIIDGDAASYEVPKLSLAEALADVGIVVGPFDEINVPLATTAREGMEVNITRNASGTLTEEKITEFDTIEEPDPSLPAGQREVVSEGQEGIVRTAFMVYTSAGEETRRDELASVVVQEAEDRVVRVGTGPGGSGGRPPTPGEIPTDNFPPVSPGSAQEIAQKLLPSYGWDDSQFTCLQTLWQRESGWNYRATNPSTGAYGIPQALPGSKMASAGADWRTNPATQIKWGLGYIRGRYATPCGALNFFHAHSWY
ncbi:MAG: G5 domain-containing protein [Bowdeniella nasicola]|nr:G5 domain-containing protein [Bowdeniella nasicola]